MLLLLFLTFSALVANPKHLLYTVANPARGLLNREKEKKEKSLAYTRFFPDPRFLLFALQNIAGYKNNSMFVRLGTDYEIRNGGYFESIKNSANQFISKP